MKLRLKNFRCYEEKEFDFGENGLLLLSGPSGAGKSTVLQAIMFALYGNGTKVVTYGKTSCKVELDFEDFHIIRTKKPNRLVLNETYEDASAQALIDKKFGKTFDVTGYIAQNATNSFVTMSPMDKLSFLERFAFADIDLTQLKHKCREIIKKRNEELIATTSQLELAANVLQETQKPEEVIFPLKGAKNKEKAINNEIIRLKNTETLFHKTERSLNKHKAEEASLNVLNAKTKTKNQALNTVIEKLDDLLLEKQNIEFEGDDVLKTDEEKLLSVVSRRELQLLESRYEEDSKRLEEMIQAEKKEIEGKVTHISKELWKEYTDEEIKTTVSEYKQLLKDAKQVVSLQENLKNYEVDEEQLNKNKSELEKYKPKLEKKKELLSKLKLQQELYTCPACSETLRFQDDELHIAEGQTTLDSENDIETITKEIAILNSKVSHLEYEIPHQQNRLDRRNEINLKLQGIRDQYEEDLPAVVDVEDDLEYIQEYKKSQLELEKHKKELETNLENNKFSLATVSFEDSLKKQKKRIKQLQEKHIIDNIDSEIDEQELRVKIQTQKRNKEKLGDIERQVTVLNREKSAYQTEIIHDKEEHIKLYKKIRSVEKIQKIITQRKDELNSLGNKMEKHSQNVKLIEKYLRYVTELEKYQEWIDKVDELKLSEEEGRKKYAAITLLKEKIIEAESIAMINIINSINSHVQEYLDLFFTIDPISARLLPYKETKKSNLTKKPQINIQIEYKGMEADLTMLSGGELSRVNLAYTLALGEIFNTPLMLLDECTASLDQELNSTVIDGIRENYLGKMVIIISHQSIGGIYDREIKI